MAYARQDQPADIQLFEIQQLVAPGQVAVKPLLPSVRYHAADQELSDDDFIFSRNNNRAVIGEAARLLGSKTTGRLVTSAKSWLSHPSVDHNAAILPWGSDDITKNIACRGECKLSKPYLPSVGDSNFQMLHLNNKIVLSRFQRLSMKVRAHSHSKPPD